MLTRIVTLFSCHWFGLVRKIQDFLFVVQILSLNFKPVKKFPLNVFWSFTKR